MELLREAIAAANRRDFDAFVVFVSPDVVWESRSSSPFPGFRDVYRGRAEVREWVAQALEVIEDAQTEVEEIERTWVMTGSWLKSFAPGAAKAAASPLSCVTGGWSGSRRA